MIDCLIAAVQALDADARRQFLDGLRAAGVLSHRGGERKRTRNDEIIRLHGRGLTPGQIAGILDMTRDAVRKVLRCRNGGIRGCTHCKIGNGGDNNSISDTRRGD